MEIKKLTKSFGTNRVLSGIDLTVKKGDVIAILGPSGSGKTTLLRCINFLEKSDSGTMVFDGRDYDLGHMRNADIVAIRKKTGGLTTARKMDKEKARAIGMEMLEKVGLADHADYYPIQLSGGQQQRVAIARALAANPEIIYFDEPTSALDPELIGEVLSVMKQLAEDGMTMLVVTHELSFAENVSNRVIFMENGNIVEQGPSKEFFANPREQRTREFLKNIRTQHDA